MLSLTASRTRWGRKCPRETHVAYQSSASERAVEHRLIVRATTLQRSQNGTFHAATAGDALDLLPVVDQRRGSAHVLAPFRAGVAMTFCVNGEEHEQRGGVWLEETGSTHAGPAPEPVFEATERPRGQVRRMEPPMQIETEPLTHVCRSGRHPPQDSVLGLEPPPISGEDRPRSGGEPTGNQDVDVGARVGGRRPVQALLQVRPLEHQRRYARAGKLDRDPPGFRLRPQRGCHRAQQRCLIDVLGDPVGHAISPRLDARSYANPSTGGSRTEHR